VNGYAYDENGQRRWVLAAGAVLAIVALLAVAFIAGRSSAPSSGGRAQVVNAQGGPGPTRAMRARTLIRSRSQRASERRRRNGSSPAHSTSGKGTKVSPPAEPE
jgi:hypothetical protein